MTWWSAWTGTGCCNWWTTVWNAAKIAGKSCGCQQKKAESKLSAQIAKTNLLYSRTGLSCLQTYLRPVIKAFLKYGAPFTFLSLQDIYKGFSDFMVEK